MRITAIALTIIMATASHAVPVEHDPLAELRAVLDDEARALDTMITFHKLQQTLIRWDRDLAWKYERDGQSNESEAQIHSGNKRLDTLFAAWELVLNHYPNNAQALNYHGELLNDYKGDVDGALHNWKLAATLDKELSSVRNNLALHYSHIGDYRLALNYLEEAIELEPDHPDYLFNLAQLYLIHFPQVAAIKDWEKPKVYAEAMELSRRATELSPTEYPLAVDYATNFFAAKNFGVTADWKKAAEAWRHTRSVARNADETFFTWLNEARCHKALNDSETARTCVESALKIRPQSQRAKNLMNQFTAEPAS
jgi:tetratricopeptide (TPR) repeat protein